MWISLEYEDRISYAADGKAAMIEVRAIGATKAGPGAIRQVTVACIEFLHRRIPWNTLCHHSSG